MSPERDFHDQNPADEAAGSGGPNPADELAAASSRAGAGILVELVGGGEGPGWNGDYYEGIMVQKGIVGRFEGSLDEIRRQVDDRAGGALYKWSGIGSDGKPRSGTFRIPGPPKLHHQNDPAAREAYDRANAERENRARYAQAAQDQQQAGAYAGNFGSGSVPAADLPYLNNRWVWIPDQFRYAWISLDGNPPPGPPPRHPPFTGTSFGGGSYSPQGDPRDELLKEIVKELRDSKKGGDGGAGNATTLILQAMQMQMAQSTQAEASRRADEQLRWQREQALKAEQETSRKEMIASQERIELARIKSLEKQAPPDMATALNAQLDLHKKMSETFGGGKKEEAEEGTTAERIGEKVVDGLNNFLKFGKEFLEDRKETRKKDAKKGGGSETPSGAGANGKTSSDEGIDAQTLQWVKILEAVHDHYQNGHPPDRALEGVAQCCRGMDVEFDSVVSNLQKFDKAQDLFAVLDLASDTAKKRLEPIANDLGNGAGLSWLNNVLGRVKMLGK